MEDDNLMKEDHLASSSSSSSTSSFFPIKAHLAWNGQVYQTQTFDTVSSDHHQQQQQQQPDFQDTWEADIADTHLVGRTVVQAAIQEVYHEITTRATSSSSSSKTLASRLHRQLAQKLSTVLVNAEYAMCIVVEEEHPTNDVYIYYARDTLGRRSLLQWEPSSTTLQSNPETTTSTSTTHFHGLQWQLASVATPIQVSFESTNDTTENNNNSNRLSLLLKGWTEVPPGRLFCYHTRTRQTTSLAVTCTTTTTMSVPDHLPNALDIAAASEFLYDLLLQAVQRRVGIQQYPSDATFTSKEEFPATSQSVNVLFSGGLDSVVLAALVLQVQSSVTLINVSFVEDDGLDSSETQRSVSNTLTTKAADTLAAQASYQELCTLYPQRIIRFVQAQHTWAEIVNVQSSIDFQALLYPQTSVMDINIATALWFAAQAVPKSTDDTLDGSIPIRINRILLSGLGADEQMGGYGRHRKAWQTGGDEQLRKELDMDMNRLWQRNLGRDDRVLSDASKEARFPFLDPHVVQFLKTLPMDCICDFSLPNGQGDKRILRLVAQRLGLESASVAVKRAIQFGSRIAHVSDKKRFGSRRKATGQANSCI